MRGFGSRAKLGLSLGFYFRSSLTQPRLGVTRSRGSGHAQLSVGDLVGAQSSAAATGDDRCHPLLLFSFSAVTSMPTGD